MNTEYRTQNSDNRLQTSDQRLKKKSSPSCYLVGPFEKTNPIFAFTAIPAVNEKQRYNVQKALKNSQKPS